MRNRSDILSGILIMIMILATMFPVAGSPADTLIRNAEAQYNEGNYFEAIENYEQVISLGYDAAEIYYNLGNSYYKLNDFTSAILFYEKARKLDPNDEDIYFNLQLANSRIIDKIEPVPELFYISWWKNLRNLLSVDGWARTALISFLVFLILIAVFLINRRLLLRKISFWSGIIILLISIFAFILAAQKYNRYIAHSEAIIFTPTVTVKSSPSEKSVDLFVIHEGTKVEIRDVIKDWNEIRIANGSIGWVKENTLKRI